EIKIHRQVSPRDIGKIPTLVKLPPKPPVCLRFIVTFLTVSGKRLGKRHCKIHRSRTRPACRLPVTGNQCIVYYTDKCPYIFAVIVVDSRFEVKHNVGIRSLCKSITMQTYPLRSSQLGRNIVVRSEERRVGKERDGRVEG